MLALDFDDGTLILTEAGSKRRASLHVVQGRDRLRQHDPGGLEVLDATLADFCRALRRENHTLKRALTDPHLFSGIGNAYSDEILHAARLSPFKQTQAIGDEEVARLFDAVRTTLLGWSARLREETGDGFPEKVTAFREGMAVHGRYGQPCPVCGSPVQRVVYAANEANYCATCQTGGRLLADRSLSRLLRDDWPRTLEELETSRPKPRRWPLSSRPSEPAADCAQRPGKRPEAPYHSSMRTAARRSPPSSAVCCPPARWRRTRAVLRCGGDAEGGAPFVEADPRDPSRVVGFEVDVAALLAGGPRPHAAVRAGRVHQPRCGRRARRLRHRAERHRRPPGRRARLAVTRPVLRVPRGADGAAERRRAPDARWPTCAAGAWRRSARRWPPTSSSAPGRSTASCR